MKGVFQIFRFTFLEQARKKSFVVSTVILYLVVAFGIALPVIIGQNGQSSAGAPSGGAGTVYVIDSGVLSGNTVALADGLGGYNVVMKSPSDKAELMDEVKADSSKSLLIISLIKGYKPAVTLYSKDVDDGPSQISVTEAVKDAYGESLLLKNKVSPALSSMAFQDVAYSSMTLGRGTVGGMIASFAVTIILFFGIYMYGYWVAMSIASEKTSRVMEVLVTSTRPSRIIIGKSLGEGVLGLLQLLGLIVVGALTYLAVYPKNFGINGLPINLSTFSPFAILMIVVYFIFGFALYAMLDAVCGSTVSRAEDIQQALMPVSLIVVLSYTFSYFSLATGNDKIVTAASLIPFSSPFSMPSRMLSAQVPAWQILLSLLLLAVTAVLLGFFSIRIYSSAVLHYGKRLRLSDILHMTKA